MHWLGMTDKHAYVNFAGGALGTLIGIVLVVIVVLALVFCLW
jgi:hypothetical protein